jgi:hypothetical protein
VYVYPVPTAPTYYTQQKNKKRQKLWISICHSLVSQVRVDFKVVT